jgi:hypothetical protein
MPALDRAGTFNAQPFGWSLRKPERSKALILDISFLVLEMKNPLSDAFEDISRAVYEVKGSQWIIGSNGERQDRTLETLIRVLNWNGDPEQFRIPATEPGGWQPPKVQITVEHRKWRDKRGVDHDSYEAKYINPLGWKGNASSINDTQFDDVKRQLEGMGLGAAVAALKSGKAPPAPPPPAFVTPVAPIASPTMPPAVFPSMPPAVSPVVPAADPWSPPPGSAPFTGQF